MEPEQRGRRASSTSSLGREVRCGCQYYQSDSLLPERRALLVRPSSRTMQQPPAVRCSEHEYEPIAPPQPHPAMAPVVRIVDTDVMPVADSDDSIDDRGRLPPELILDGDLILPLDGKIEDSAMEGREAVGGIGDTSEEQEPTVQQFQDRLEERFLDAPTPYIESRTDGEVNTSQVDSSAIEELPLRRGARGLSQRMKTEASKLRSRLRSIQRPTFSFPQKRQKPDKKKTTTTTTTTTTTRSTAASSGKSEKSRKSVEKRPSRMDRIRTSISEKTAKFSLPLDRTKFSFPDRSKFHLPEKPRFSFPDKSRFHLPDKSKFSIKKPNIRLSDALARVKRPSLREQQQQHSTESTIGSRRNIFDFATYPRIFDKKSKKRGEYATSSPKDSRTQSAESATLPRAGKGKRFSDRWSHRFGHSAYISDQDRDRPEDEAAASDGSPPWHQSSIEEPPRLSARTEEEIMAAARAIPWEDTRKREQYDEEEIQYMDYEQESSEISDRHPAPPRRLHKRRHEESYEREEVMDPRLYGNQETKHREEVEEDEDAMARDDWRVDQEMMLQEKFKPIPRSRSLDEDIPRVLEREGYDGAFMAVDPRQFGPRKMASEEEKEEEGELEEAELEEHEPSSMQSDREQQASSGSSCDRRRRGVIEEIDSDEFFVRASGISQDDVNLDNYLTDEIREALRSKIVSALQDDELPPSPPPQRPMRTRTLRKRKEDLAKQSTEMIPPVRPKRERAAARRSREASIVDEMFRERTRSDSRSDSRHRVVYQAERNQQDSSQEPLDDIVVVKPVRRKSKSSLRSQSQPPMETSILFSGTPVTLESSILLSATPPVVPVRRKRSHRETIINRRNGNVSAPIYNGHRGNEWEIEIIESKKPAIPTRSSRSRQSLIERNLRVSTSRENFVNLDARHRRAESAPESVPIPPKRRSRSRGTSVAADEDRTSHGAESLPEAGYVEEDIPREDESGSARDFNGYAIVEKREKPPPRPPPPRRKRNKFATTPRPTPPKRPQRAYSTLGPARTRDTSMASESIIGMTPADSAPYIEIDAEDIEHRDLRSGMLNKIQGRPLPAPPRPPRARREHVIVERPRTPFEYSEMMETTTATQTDPLPDDMVIEEITQAKLIMTPSRSGSQVMVSMERIPSPSRTSTPPVPPLPISQFMRKEEEKEEERQEEDIRMTFDTVSLTTPSPMREIDLEDKHKSTPHLKERIAEEPRPQIRSPGLLSDEPLRISSLEVGDLKVDRLSVSQIEAHKIVASEVDAMMITASELRGGSGSLEESFSPAIIRELMAIRSHLETVVQVQERHRESEESASRKIIPDIPTTDDSQVRKQESVLEEDSQDPEVAEFDVAMIKEPAFTEDKEIEDKEMKDKETEDKKTKDKEPEVKETEVKETEVEETEVEETEVEETEVEETEVKETEVQETEADNDQKVVKTDIIDVKDNKLSHALSVAQTKEFPSLQTPAIDELESQDKDESTIHLLTVAQDKSLQILDSEHPLTLSLQTTSGSHVDESRASYPTSDVPSTRPSELRVSPERVDEPSSSSVQTTITTTTTTTTTTATATTTTTTTATTTIADPDTTSTSLRGSKDDLSDNTEQIPRKSRSRSPSPSKGIMRQTASPVRSLPPAISVTPDTPDSIVQRRSTSVDAQPQRAVISYSNMSYSVPKDAQPQHAVISHSSDTEQSLRERQREFSESPVSPFPLNSTHFIAFPASEIPVQFFSLNETNRRINTEPGVIDTTQQLLRVLRSAGIKAMRHFIRYLTSTLSIDDTREKIREVELAICALLLLIVGLLIYYFNSTRTVTHMHHWDYFNPPQ